VINELHITVAETVNGAVKVLYAGKDVLAAEEAFDLADGDHSIVCIAHHIFPTRVRYPAQEQADAVERVTRAVREAVAAEEKKLRDAEAAEAKANELLAQAKALRGEAPEPAPEGADGEQPKAAKQPKPKK
jgi:hypothetical protein